MQNLWGDEFEVPTQENKLVNEILDKISNPESLDKKEFKKLINKKSLTLLDRLRILSDYVKNLLREHIGEILVIRSKEDLVKYVDNIINDGVWAFDTETTNSLDPYTGKVLGLCLYSPNQKSAYVPIWHVDPVTDELLPNQVTDEDCKEQLQRIKDAKIFTVMHNGKFDYKFTKKSVGVPLNIDWDTMIASRMIDENELTAGLKWQYKEHVDPNHPLYDIEELFPVPYKYVDPEIFALYSATDAMMTYKLFLYQKGILYQPDQKNALKLFLDVEMPLIIPVAEMELDGIKFDKEYSDRLQLKYTKILEEYDVKLNEELSKIQPQIDEWRKTPDALEQPKVYAKANSKKDGYPYHDAKGYYKLGKSKNDTLETPINTESPAQLAILLYDILKFEPAFEDNPRSTDKYAMEVYVEERHSSLCEVISERKTIVTLLQDFIKKLPTLVNPVTHKIHCNFNQTGKEDRGVVTGRFSSSEPNLQQIPSKNNEVRLLFCGDVVYNESEYIDFEYKLDKLSEVLTNNDWKYSINLSINDVIINDGEQVIITDILIDDCVRIKVNKPFSKPLNSKIEYVLCGSDYSGQEPRLTAYYSQDDIMIQAYKDSRDLYSVIAQFMYHNRYEDNLEFYPEGEHIVIDGEEVICGFKTHKNKAGKKRRSAAKTVLLGMLYGRGANSIASQLETTREEGQKIIDDFFKLFPKVKEWIDKTHDKVKKLQYVEDWYGRRRHLKDIGLPKYSLDFTSEYKKTHNNFNPILCCQDRVDNTLLLKYDKLLQEVRGKKQLQNLINQAKNEGVEITDNEGRIARAERQSVNAIVQGGAATLTKMAMVNIYNDKELTDLGLRMLVPIHDELLCTCPKINGERASQRLVEVMVDTAKPYINVPMSCDPYLVTNWYFDEMSAQIQNEFDHLQEGDEDKGIKGLPRDQAFEKLKEIHCELLEKDIIRMLENK